MNFNARHTLIDVCRLLMLYIIVTLVFTIRLLLLTLAFGKTSQYPATDEHISIYGSDYELDFLSISRKIARIKLSRNTRIRFSVLCVCT
jgi:hypothetical protein